MRDLDDKLPIPIYARIREDLRRKIESGDLRPGDRIPSEYSLAGEYGVTRMTVRQAIWQLVNAGLVKSRRGLGNFVAAPTIEHPLRNAVQSFDEDVLHRGLQPGVRLLSVRQLPATPEVSSALDIVEGESVTEIQRLRLADLEPIALQVIRMPDRLFPGLRNRDLSGSTNHLAEQEYHLRIIKAQQRIEATSADSHLASVLEVRKGSPVLHIRRIGYAQPEMPYEFAEVFYRHDRYAYTVTLFR